MIYEPKNRMLLKTGMSYHSHEERVLEIYRAQSLLNLFEVEDQVQEIKRLGGYSSQNFAIIGKIDQYVLKKLSASYEVHRDEILASYRVFQTKNINVCCPFHLENGPIRSMEREDFLLFPFMAGNSHNEDTMSDHSLRAAAHLLSSIHLAEPEERSRSIVDYHPFVEETFINLLDKALDPRVKEMIRLKLKFKEKLSSISQSSYPKGLIHGDFHCENIIFKNSDSEAIILDLEASTIGDQGKDFVKFIDLSCCNTAFDSHQIGLARTFMKHYRQNCSLDFSAFKLAVERYLLDLASSSFFESAIIEQGQKDLTHFLERDLRKMRFYETSLMDFCKAIWK